VIRGKLDDLDELQIRRLDGRRDVGRRHPHIRPRTARLPQDGRFLTGATMPIDNDKTSARLEDCCDAACQPWLIGHTMERISDQDEFDRAADQLSDRIGVPFDKPAIGRPGCRKLALRNAQQVRGKVDSDDVAARKGKRCRKQAIAATEVNNLHARSKAHGGENLVWVRPKGLPPIRVWHCCRREKSRQTGVVADTLHEKEIGFWPGGSSLMSIKPSSQIDQDEPGREESIRRIARPARTEQNLHENPQALRKLLTVLRIL